MLMNAHACDVSMVERIEGSSKHGHFFSNVSGFTLINQWEMSSRKIIFGDYINEAVCYLHNSSPWVCNPVLINFIQNK